MEPAEVFTSINYWAVLVAALASFIVGSLWYGPIFGKLWMQLHNYTKEEIEASNIPFPVIMVINYIAAALAAFALAMFLGAEASVGFGVFAGLMVAVFWIGTSRLNDVLFERQPLKLYFINVGYNIIIYVLMGAILGRWS